MATGNSSLLTDWRLRRRKFALADVLGIELPSASVVRREHGKGRVVYLPRIAPAMDPPKPEMNYGFSPAYWKLPLNHADLAEALAWAEQIASYSPAAVQATKRLALFPQRLSEAEQKEIAAMRDLVESKDDFKQGATAFTKRA